MDIHSSNDFIHNIFTSIQTTLTIGYSHKSVNFEYNLIYK